MLHSTREFPFQAGGMFGWAGRRMQKKDRQLDMRGLFLLLVSVIMGISRGLAPSTHLINGTLLLQARESVREGQLMSAFHSMLGKAKSYSTDVTPWSMARGPWSVINKTIAVPSSVSPNNYISIGIYNHPCNNLPKGCTPYPGSHLLPPWKCNNQTGFPWEPCDGQRNPTAIALGDSPRQSKMADAVKSLSYGAFFCNETSTTSLSDAICLEMAQRAGLILRTWFVDNATAMLPNLYYGQILPNATPPPKGKPHVTNSQHKAQHNRRAKTTKHKAESSKLNAQNTKPKKTKRKAHAHTHATTYTRARAHTYMLNCTTLISMHPHTHASPHHDMFRYAVPWYEHAIK